MRTARQQKSRKLNGKALTTPKVNGVTEWRNTSKIPIVTTLVIGTPTLGKVRIEWANALASMVAPCNFSLQRMTPMGYPTHTGQNIIVHEFLQTSSNWLLLLEDDNVPPAWALVHLSRYIEKADVPIVSGLYYLKASFERELGPEPLIYRGGGTRCFRDWKPGDKVWASGVPTGCLLIHRSILEAFSREPDIAEVEVQNRGAAFKVKEIFQRPHRIWTDDDGMVRFETGTSDLEFCKQVMDRNIFVKAGWPKFAKKQYPFLVDTHLKIGHIDFETGTVY